MVTAFRANDPAVFNKTLDKYSAEFQHDLPRRVWKAKVESVFNQLEPFYSAMVIYVLILSSPPPHGWSGRRRSAVTLSRSLS